MSRGRPVVIPSTNLETKEVTVTGLIRLLQSIENEHPNAEIVLEGCDCYGDWNGKVEVSAARVLLCR